MGEDRRFVIEKGILKRYLGAEREVVIPSGVTYIGPRAFSFCADLERVTIPEGVTRIGEKAFVWCRHLSRVTVPESLTEIGREAFQGCAALEDSRGMLILKGRLLAYHGPGGLVEIPAGVTRVCEQVFAERADITEVRIPEGVTHIEKEAFRGCEKLARATLPGSLRSLGAGAFQGCLSLERAEIPEGVPAIEGWTFDGCRSLKRVTIPASAKRIGASAFADCASLMELALPEGLTGIGSWAFSGCRALTRLEIPGSVTAIGESAIFGCEELRELTLREGVAKIGRNAFMACGNLARIFLPDSLRELPSTFLPDWCVAAIRVSDPGALPREYDANIAAGFAVFGGGRESAHYAQYASYLRDNAQRMIPMAKLHPELLFFLCREGLIPLDQVERYTEAARAVGDPAAMAAMLDYETNHFSADEREAFARRQEAERERAYARRLAREGKTGLEGLNVLVTGRLWSFKSREALAAFLAERGAALQQSLTPETDYVISCYDRDEELLQNAGALGIEILSERGLNDLAGRVFELRGGTLLRYLGEAAEVTIPPGVTKIADGVFRRVRSLRRLTIPASVTELGREPFWGCSQQLTIRAPRDSAAAKFAAERGIPLEVLE